MGSIADPMVAPANYAEFFDQYSEYVTWLVRKAGIHDAEDVAQEILTRFYERDFLNKFDPTVITRSENAGRARFQSFVNAFVNTYAMGMRERQAMWHSRFPVIADMLIDENRTVAEVVGTPEHSAEQAYLDDANPHLESLREHLASTEVAEGVTCRDVLDLILEHHEEPRRRSVKFPIPVRYFEEKYGISRNAAYGWMTKTLAISREFLEGKMEIR